MNERQFTVNPHLLHLTKLLYPYLTLLIIPIIRAVIGHFLPRIKPSNDFIWAEAVILSVAVAISVLRLKKIRLVFGQNIFVEKGLLFKTEYAVPKTSSVVVLESDFLLRLFGTFRLKIYTDAGFLRRPTESLLISKRDAMQIYSALGAKGQTVQSNTLGEIIMSAALSSSGAGVLLSIPAIKIIAGVMGESVPSLLPKVVQAGESSFNFSNIVRLVTTALVVGYIISFLVLFLRNYAFSSVKENGKIMLKSGRLPHRTVLLNTVTIRAVKTVTAPLMLLAGKCAVKFSACGYGKRKGEIGLLIPCVKRSLSKGLTRWLLPEMAVLKAEVCPPKAALRRCAFVPLLIITGGAASGCVAVALKPIFYELIILAAVGVAVCGTVLLFIRRNAVKYGGISLNNEGFYAMGTNGFKITDLEGRKKDIYCFKISRTPFDKRHKQCSVKVYVANKNGDAQRVKFLDYCQVKSLFKNYGRQSVNNVVE